MTLTKKLSSFLGRRDMDMTEGSIFGKILRFSMPLLVGNLFQQLYNLVDTWVVGNSGNNAAYSAVGSVGSIINILIGFYTGLATGAGVVISRYYGAKNEKGVRESVHTSMMMTLILAVIFTIVGITMTPLMLRLMLKDKSPEIYNEARIYLTIYFAGIISLMVYNMCAGILRAVGDSLNPFLFLCASAAINTVLDLVFVNCFGMVASGVAIATVIAQTVSATLGILTLLKNKGWIKLRLRDLKINFGILGEIIKVGIPAALQMALTSFSNVFVQGYIAGVKGDQSVVLGAWTSYSKIDQLMFLPMQTLGLTVTTFVGQNIGKGDIARARKGTFIAYGMALATTAFFMVPIIVFAPQVAAIFNPNPEIVELAAKLLQRISPFYLCCCLNQVFAGSLRGAGNSLAPMLIMLSCFVGFRQIYLYLMTTFGPNEILPVGFGYPLGWFLCSIGMFTAFMIYYHKLMKKAQVDK